MTSALKVTALALLGVGLVLVGLAQIFTWNETNMELTPEGRAELGAFGAAFDDIVVMEAYQWGATIDPNDEFMGECTVTWFGDPVDSCEGYEDDGEPEESSDGEVALRTGFILMIAGGAIALVGLILMLAMSGKLGGILALVGAAIFLGSVISTLVGLDQFVSGGQEEFDSDPEIGGYMKLDGNNFMAGTWVGMGAALLLLIGGIMALMTPAGTSTTAAPAPAAGPGRNLTCPKCRSNVFVPEGQKPSCNNCGFGK